MTADPGAPTAQVIASVDQHWFALGVLADEDRAPQRDLLALNAIGKSPKVVVGSIEVLVASNDRDGGFFATAFLPAKWPPT